jgi:hypothetical protein
MRNWGVVRWVGEDFWIYKYWMTFTLRPSGEESCPMYDPLSRNCWWIWYLDVDPMTISMPGLRRIFARTGSLTSWWQHRAFWKLVTKHGIDLQVRWDIQFDLTLAQGKFDWILSFLVWNVQCHCAMIRQGGSAFINKSKVLDATVNKFLATRPALYYIKCNY